MKFNSNAEKIAYYNALEYSVILKKKKGTYFLIISELALVSESPNLEEAYEELNLLKQSMIKSMINSNSDDELPLPNKVKNRISSQYQIKIFVYKLLIVCLLLAVTIAVSGTLIVNKVSTISPAAVIKGKIKGITQLFEVTEKEQQHRIKKLRQTIIVLEPYLNEIIPLFSPGDNSKRKQNDVNN